MATQGLVLPIKTDSYPLPTGALFYENNYDVTPFTVFTINENDKEVKGHKFYSLRKLYMEMEDPTEYEFAQAVFGSWDWWNLVKKSYKFKHEFEKWPVELELKLKAKAFAKIKKAANNGDFRASAFLVTKGYNKEETGAQKGRPSKAQVKAEAKRLAEMETEFKSDAERLGIVN